MLLRNVLDHHSESIQIAKLQRDRQYDDELQHFDYMHPENAPKWAYIEQKDMAFDTEIDSQEDEERQEDKESL